MKIKIILFAIMLFAMTCVKSIRSYYAYYPFEVRKECKLKLKFSSKGIQEGISSLDIFIKPKAEDLKKEFGISEYENVFISDFHINKECRNPESISNRCKDEFLVGCSKVDFKLRITILSGEIYEQESAVDLNQNPLLYIKMLKGVLYEIK
ncbi:hypothetical protein [Leptospira yasudae]|uniref:hypothetical protein n=1 Tax=Leptospira yasudae TaxID=2202201 RepID=UPI0010913138|nr:hypothetical protein [Leptospira yasudae]TGM99703.1 hypothetical protein EHR10_08925 [Leptospira yasudae]